LSSALAPSYNRPMSQLYGAVEAGGTKLNCAVGSGPQDLVTQRIPTTSPRETIDRVITFFRSRPPVKAIGIGSFGPLDLDPDSRTFGYITTTPKPGWQYVDITGELKRALGVPVYIDTDVNAAALGEHTWGAARGLDNFIYLTIGTGIGGGGMVNGKLLHGLVHPEMGHIRIPHDLLADPFPGCCPFHGDCFEGLASGTAVAQRWGHSGQTLPADHPAWPLEGRYIALAVSNFILTLSPQRVILGGGLMSQTQLFPLVRREVVDILHGYVQALAITKDIDSYIVAPQLGNGAGLAGALALAMNAQ
jgi:fructokinase